MAPTSRIEQPPAGKALINMHRPSNFGGGQDYPIFDRTHLVGNLKGGSVLQYICDPGEHILIGRADHVTVLQANVVADKVYDVALDVGVGFMKANVVLTPITKTDARKPNLASWDAREKPLALVPSTDAANYERKSQPDLELIIKDFTGGEKKDRLKILALDDCR